MLPSLMKTWLHRFRTVWKYKIKGDSSETINLNLDAHHVSIMLACGKGNILRKHFPKTSNCWTQKRSGCYLYWHWSSAAPSQRPHEHAAVPAGTGSSAFPSLSPEKHTQNSRHHTHFTTADLDSCCAGDGIKPQMSFLCLPPPLPLHPLHSSEDTNVNFQNVFFTSRKKIDSCSER